MNKVFSIVWSRALRQFVVASELVNHAGKGARASGGRASSGALGSRRALVLALGLVTASSAIAHTTSIGYANSGNNSLSFYYGTYHQLPEANYTEGSLHLTSTAGFDQTVSFSILTSTKPTGLVDGDTNFYSNGTQLVGKPTITIYNWQGVTFNNLVHGTYTFTYVPIARPTQVWAPTDSVILSNTITIINADLSTAHRIVAGEVVDQTYATDPVILDGGKVRNTADGTLTQEVSITANNGTFDTNGHTLTLTGEMDGRGALIKEGEGTLNLRGDNTSVGEIDLNGGNVNVLSDAALGDVSNDLKFNGGTLQWGAQFDLNAGRDMSLGANGGTLDLQGFDTNVANVITGTGSLTKTGTGTLTVSGANTYTGGTNVAQGDVVVASTGALGTGVLTVDTGSTVSMNNAAQTVAGLAGGGSIALDGTALTLNGTGTNTTFGGELSGTGGLIKNGSGTQTLSGVNTYTGGTTINGGTLAISADDNLGATSPVTFGGGTLETTATMTTGRDLLLSGNGTLNTDVGTTLTATGDVSGTGGLTKTGQGNLVASGVLSQGGGVTNNAGTLSLTGDNTYTGGTHMNGGTIVVGSDANLGDASSPLTFGGGALELTNGFDTSRDIAMMGTGTIRVDQGEANLDGPINGSGVLTAAGTGTVSINGPVTGQVGLAVSQGVLAVTGNNSYTGGTFVSGTGTLVVSDDANLGDVSGALDANGGNIVTTGDFASGRTINTHGAGLQWSAGNGGDTLLSGTIQGTGGVNVTGSGTTVLSGTNTYTGGTAIHGGTLQIDADANLGAANGGLLLDGATLHTTSDLSTGRAITVMNGSSLSTDTGTTLTASGSIGGDTLVKTGEGTLVLDGTNTYTGGTVIEQGTLQVGSDAALGAAAGGLTLQGGTLHTTADIASARDLSLAGGDIAVDADTTFATSGGVAGAGGLVKNGEGTLEIDGVASHTSGTTVNEGTLVLTGNNTYTGGTMLNGGTLQVGSDANLGAASGGLVFNGGALHATGNVTGNRVLTLDADAQIQTDAGASFATAGVVSGAGGIVKSGEGTLVLSGTNTYEGDTTLDEGTLEISADANLGAPGSSLVFNGGTLHTTANLASQRAINLAQSAVFATDAGTVFSSTGTVSGDGGLVKNGAGTLALGGALSHAGGTTVNDGTLVLSGKNSYTGGTQLNGGTLSIASDDNLGDAANAVTFNGGNLTTTGSFSTARGLVVTDAGGSLTTAAGTTFTQTGTISGTGSLTKLGDGLFVVSGANTFTGNTYIEGGTVRIDNGSSLGFGDIYLQGGTLQTFATLGTGQNVLVSGSSGVNVTGNTTTVLSGNIDAAGATGCFVKSGSGALSLTGHATLGAGTCVQEGLLRANGALDSAFVQVDSGAALRGIGKVTGPVNVSGRLAPGNSPGTLTVDGTVTMNAGSTFEADIDGYGTGTGRGNYSRLLVVGAGHQFIANGTLDPMLRGITGDASNTFTPVLGDSFRIVSAEGGIVGQFANIAQPSTGLPANTRFLAFYNLGGSNSIDLRVVPRAYSDFLGAGASKNTLALAGALDAAIDAQAAGNGMGYVGAVNAIGALGTDRIADTVKAMAGEVHADQAAAARGMGLALNRDAFGHLAVDGVDPANKVWANVTQDGQRFVADHQGSGYNTSTSHVTGGVDLISNESTVIGVGASHGESNTIATGGEGTIRGNAGMIYGQQKAGAIVLDGVVSYGTSDWSTRRADPFGNGSLETHADGHDTMASLTARLPLATAGGVRLEPYASVIWQKVERDAVDETGNSPAALNLGKLSATGVRSLVGLTAGSNAADPLATELTWRVGVAAGIDSGRALDPAVQASVAGQTFQTKAPNAGRGFVQVNANGTMRLGASTYLFGGLTGEQGSGRTGYGVTAGVRVAF